MLLVGDVQLGEDLVQEVFAKMATRWHQVRAMTNPDGYVQRALINAAISWRRRRLWREEPMAVVPDSVGPELPPYDDAMLRLLRQLPPRQRAVMVLRHYLDQTEAETAATMECTVGTVKSQHAKAVATMRRLFAQAEAHESPSPDASAARQRQTTDG
jgi:RNA polymerase sigma-70 factor (sigma-E family)